MKVPCPCRRWCGCTAKILSAIFSGVFSTAAPLIRQPYHQEVDVYQRQVTLHETLL